MRQIWARIRYLFRREPHARELDEELEAHLEMAIEANVERGMSPEEARRLARREFGNPARVRESAQEAWLFHWLESMLQDIRYGLRQFRRAPGLFLAVIVSLAIGLGSSTAIFSLIEAAVLRPLPVADPDRLIHLHWRNDEQPAGVFRVQRRLPGSVPGGMIEASNVADPIFRAFAERQTGFASLIGVVSTTDEIAISAPPEAPAEQVRALTVSRNFFDGLGVPLVLGRSFLEEEDRPGAALAVVVSHRFWSSRLGRNPDAIGQVIRIDGEPARVVGVAPLGFYGLSRGLWIDVYRPLASVPLIIQELETTNWTVDMVARLPPNVPGPAAAAAMTPLFRSIVAETLGTEVEEELELFARPASRGLWWGAPPIEEVSQALRILMLLVGVLLLIVCANVANLLLSRSASRQRESAVRLSLGAGRWRLIRQHLVESGMLAVIGGGAGLGLGVALASAIHRFFQTGQGASNAFAVMLDWRVFGYSAAVTVLTLLLFGLAPAWAAARPKVNDALRIQSRSVLGGGLRVPRFLVSAQFALSFAALIAAGLLGRSLGNLYVTDLGFDGEQVSYATVHPDRAGYSPLDFRSYIERLQQEIAAIPGVLAVAPLNDRLLDGGSLPGPIFGPDRLPGGINDGSVAPDMSAAFIPAGPGIVDALGLRLLAGRALEPGDDDRCSRPEPNDETASGSLCPALVDERFAETLFPGEIAIGQRFTAAFAGDSVVVGVVANVREDLREEGIPTLYQPYGVGSGLSLSGTHFAIRAQTDSNALAAAVREAVARVDPAVPLAEFHTQTGLVDRLLRTERLLAVVSGAFTLAALVLAAVGLGGLLAYAVARRTNEIGVRMALGATGSEVRRIVLGDSLRMVSVGVLIGIPAAYAVGRYLESLLFGLQPIDPSTAALALVALFVIAGMASLLPAHRAARVNPMTALRDE
jgi:predicted permease